MIPALETAYGGAPSVFHQEIEKMSSSISVSGEYIPVKVIEAMETIATYRDKSVSGKVADRKAARANDLQHYKEMLRDAGMSGEQVSCFYYREAAEFLIKRFEEPHWRPME